MIRRPSAVGEVLAKGAVERVAVFRPVDAIDHHLAQDAEIAQHRQRHVLERQLDQLALAGDAPVALRREHGHGRRSGR